jgi:hypothetical protein
MVDVLPYYSILRKAGCVDPVRARDALISHESWMMGNTCIYRRNAIIEAGGFLPELHSFCDGFLQMVIAAKYGACYVPEPLAVFRVGSGGYSSQSLANLDVSLKMWSKAAALMRTHYADIFPRDSVDSWERKHVYLSRISAVSRAQRRRIEILSASGTNSTIRRTVVRIFGLFSRIQVMATVAYLLLRGGRPEFRGLTQAIETSVHKFAFKVRQMWTRTEAANLLGTDIS